MIGDRPTVFVVDDDHSVRKGLERLLQVKGYRVTCFPSAEDFLREELNSQVACLVLDISLPGMSGFELQERLFRQGVVLPTIFISGHGDIPMAVQAVKSGAISFLSKPFTEKELVTEIENALAVSRREFREQAEIEDLQQRYGTLTERENQILSFIISGCLNKQTAFDLGIAETTVKVHRGRIMKKMQAESVAELVAMASKLQVPRTDQSPPPQPVGGRFAGQITRASPAP
jgi:FixJ family two-component response regulator